MRKKKKRDCLFLCQFFYPEYVSSATLPYDTALILAQKGYSVGALCGYPKEYSAKENVPRKEVYQNIEINRINYIQLKRSSFWGRLVNYFSFFVSCFLKISVLQRYRIVFVYSNPPLLPILAVWGKRLFGIKIIFISYDVYPEIGIYTKTISSGGMIDRCFRYINKEIAGSADQVVALSQDMKKYLAKTRGIPEDRLAVIPNWYENIKVIGTRKKKNPLFQAIPEDAFLLSYLGNLGTCQELDTLLAAIRGMKQYDNIHFLFAGHGNKMPYLSRVVEAENLRQVHLVGFLHGGDFLDALSISAAFVLTIEEGLTGLCSPSKACSYMMAGKPIFAIADKEMEIVKEIEEENCGFYIPHGRADKLEEAIIRLLSDKKLRQDMGENSRRVFLHKYEKDICLNQYVKLVDERIKRDV